MLAMALESPSEVDLRNPALVYEPKLDGIRALVLLEPAQPSPRVTIWSRLGNEKTKQFPEVVRGLKDFAKRLRVPVIVDGEIVALGEDGEPVSFQRLQGRMHLNDAREIVRLSEAQPTAFVAFDILRDGAEDLRPLMLTARRARLERLFGASGSSTVRFGEYVAGDGRRLYQQAIDRGWEGLIVKVADSPYESNRRSRLWRKLKLVKTQEFVIGGWTEPRESRQYFGALLLGAYKRRSGAGGRGALGPLRYVGHSGTGFTHGELARVFKLLQERATKTCPFDPPPPATNERPRWVRPDLVCQVKFSEWTHDGVLRHPVYLGLRDDVDPTQVVIEPQSVPVIAGRGTVGRGGALDRGADEIEADEPGADRLEVDARDVRARDARRRETRGRGEGARDARDGDASAADVGGADADADSGEAAAAATSRSSADAAAAAGTSRSSRRASSSTAGAARVGRVKGGGARRDGRAPKGTGRIAKTVAEERTLLQLVDVLQALEDARRDGTLALPDGTSLDVTNLAKVFWPAEKLTKGDLLRFYVRVSPWLLPVVEDRPLVMKRFPNGVTAKAFYQQRAPDEAAPGVRVEVVEGDDEAVPRIIGGALVTLLYTTQLAAISQDPWFSRVQSPHFADYVALDLDPMPGVPFAQVLDVARWVHDELEALHIPAVPKTSGSSGLHVYIPLPPKTTYESGQLLCHIVATVVAMKHGRVATVERQVAKRGRKVYVDYLQNIEGKSLASAYSARASEFAGVSTPLTWDEVHAGIEPQDFTLRTALARFEQVGDLWAPIRNAPPVDLRGTLERLAASTS